MIGKIGDREGMFPLAFVEVLEELSKKKEAPEQKSELVHGSDLCLFFLNI